MTMESYLVLLLALSTSAGLVVIGRILFRLPLEGLRAAGGLMLAWLGLTAVFFAGNVLVGMTVAHVVRTVTPLFVSLYFPNDLTLLILSALQALLFQRWWTAGPRPSAS
jgi:small neutral amino acid transporter SnatA (MarC family)